MFLWVSGCSKNPVTEQPKQDTIASQFDGLTTANEAPAFGNPELASAVSEEVTVQDPIAATPRFRSLLSDPNAGLVHLRVIWGRLRYDSTSTTPTNWDGSLTITRGLEIVRSVIRFEPATDSLLPRTSPNLIEWASTTTVHNDGIAVDMLIPPIAPTIDTTITIEVGPLGDTTEVVVIDTIPAPPVNVTFATGPYTRVFTLRELARLDTIVYLDDSNAVALSAFEFDRIPCPRGFLAGHWGFDSTGAGEFNGIWVGGHGLIEGFLDGHFAIDTSGQRMFYGKWIDRDGLFQGLLKGIWGPHPNRHASERGKVRGGGWFAGRIFNANADTIGVLRGHYKGSEDLNSGFFQGRWKLNCADLRGDDDGMDDEPESDD
jgi:hypothetical protein